MKKWHELFYIGIILFILILCSLTFLIFLIVIPLRPPNDIQIDIIEFFGSDENNDSHIDTIVVSMINLGLRNDKITQIDFSMNKSWIVTNSEYPIELKINAMIETIFLTAATDQDQIVLTDSFSVEFYFASGGDTDQIMINNTDIVKGEAFFELDETITKSYRKNYPNYTYPILFIGSAIISLIISFSPLTTYLIIHRVRAN